MRSRMNRQIAVGLVACGLTFSGCGLEKVEVPGSLIGPSELGTSLEMHAIPDIVVADGIQTSVIRVIVRDKDGALVPNKDIVFTLADEQGRYAEIGTLTSASGARVFGATTIRTNSQGIAQVVYTTPERRDVTDNIKIVVFARPVGTDASARLLSSVRIDLRSAEPRRFPQGGGSAPSCSFNMAPNNPINKEGTVLRFFSTASATPPERVIRYEWYFGDGTDSSGAEGLIDVQKGYPFAGVYTVTHIVTSSFGFQSSCERTITIVP